MGLPETYVEGFHNLTAVKQMLYVPLGDTGMNVSRISLGAGGFSYFYGYNTQYINNFLLH